MIESGVLTEIFECREIEFYCKKNEIVSQKP